MLIIGGTFVTISPAALTDQRAVIGGVAERIHGRVVPLIGIADDLAGHDFHTARAVASACDSTDAPIVVVDRGDRTGHMRSVVGVGVINLPLIFLRIHIRPVERRRIVNEIISVQVALRGIGVGPDIRFQIFVRILNGLIEHGHDDVAAALTFGPCVEQVDVGAGFGDKHLLPVVIVVPLRRKQRIVHRHRRTGCGRSNTAQRPDRSAVFESGTMRIFEHRDAAVLTQFIYHLPQRKRRIESDLIPLMQPESAVALLEPRIGAEQRTDTVDAYGGKQLVGRSESRTGYGSRGERGGERIGGRRFELDDQLTFDSAFGVINDLHAGSRTSLHGRGAFRVVRTCRHRQNTQQQQNFSHHNHFVL